MSLPFFIARRYLFSKKKHNAINIISGISVCGVALATLAVSPLLTHKDLNLNATICRTGEKCKKGLMEEAEEKELIRKILEECGGKISRVARMLGMSRPTLYKKMERYGLR